jgi:hypothetical protein
MPHRFENHEPDRSARCAICDGKFGLVRQYSWRTALCSNKCVDRFRARRQNDHSWMGWFPVASNQSPDYRARVL